MLKLVAIGIWVALVTAAAAYFSAGFMAAPAQEAEHGGGLEQIATEQTSVPMIRDGTILGYVIIQLNFAVDADKVADLKLEPQPFLVDAAFRAVFQNTEADFAKLRASDIDKLTDAIREEANRRMGPGAVQQVLIQQLNYVRKEDIRTHWIKDKK